MKLKPEDCTPWFYRGKIFEEPSIDCIGFVYEIEEKETGKKYIGKKLFWKYVKRKPRGQKRVRRVQQSSDWKIYHGSSKELKEQINPETANKYNRTILHLCYSKGMLSYMELHEQVHRKVLFDDMYHNAFIGCKINQSHLKESENEEIFI